MFCQEFDDVIMVCHDVIEVKATICSKVGLDLDVWASLVNSVIEVEVLLHHRHGKTMGTHRISTLETLVIENEPSALVN